MDNDDLPLGRVLSRREVLTLLGVGGAAALLGRQSFGQPGRGGPGGRRGPGGGPGEPGGRPNQGLSATGNGCFAKPELTEGPFFVDERLNRSDIRSDPATKTLSAGVPLQIVFQVHTFAGGGCGPLANAMVDVWHCDAAGLYSDVRQNGTAGQKFLRGYQTTGKDGIARFTTIYPGWYRGRAVHIHFKIRATKENRNYEFTSQLFFDEKLTDKIHARVPYAATGQRDQRNDRDGIFREGGNQLLLSPTPEGAGYKATFDIGLQI